MKFLALLIVLFTSVIFSQCKSPTMGTPIKIIFLHHSTGAVIWKGKPNKILYKIDKMGDVERWFHRYNKKNNTNYQITEQYFPKKQPYGWNNYPYDYYNIWVKNAGADAYQKEPTLEMLTQQFDVIIFKHCFPISEIENTNDTLINIDSELKSIANYQLQYNALKKKLHTFPNTKFILWTPATHVKNNTTTTYAKNTRNFHQWVIEDWNEQGDNIFIWDFYTLQTDGELYFKDEYAVGISDSHPNKNFAKKLAPLFSQRIIDVIEKGGTTTKLTGEK